VVWTKAAVTGETRDGAVNRAVLLVLLGQIRPLSESYISASPLFKALSSAFDLRSDQQLLFMHLLHLTTNI
jgi:hypothetical protein